jgi:four helix bundle protein
MKTRVWTNPTGYKYLAIYKNAEIIEQLTRKITSKFKILESRMKVQMNDAARSFKVNIVEGWRRPTTKEYLEFLGFSEGSLAELTDNTEDCLRNNLINANDYEEYYSWLKKSDFLLRRLVKSLENKMENEKTVPVSWIQRENFLKQRNSRDDLKILTDKTMYASGNVRLIDGRYIKKEDALKNNMEIAKDFLENVKER